MEKAIALSKTGMEAGKGGPFGCVIVKDGEIIGEGSNSVLDQLDPTAHAEVVAIRAACRHLQSFQLEGCTLYTSCEPCPMCLGAIYWARPEAVYYANTKADAAAIGFDDQFIYEELDKPHEGRKIPFKRLALPQAGEAFRAWAEKEDKKVY
ncbi:Guanine deaminase [Nitritalea halalkaliphila LW7]|uniref:Guanine deaminase n=1 Tax=Nitritalea halalkaliphila LW7 TaxID=1189621 RepID=I5C9G5_9BACT|nr:Guanine deaminase [Nitritalea halalkaliphila LW7]